MALVFSLRFLRLLPFLHLSISASLRFIRSQANMGEPIRVTYIPVDCISSR